MSEPSPQRIARGIILAIAIWGTLLALGAVLFGIDPQTGEVGRETNLARGVVRGGILFIFVFAFLGLWWRLLKRREADGG